MNCIVYQINKISLQSKSIGNLKKHTEMNIWLKSNGEKDYVYEVCKNLEQHSSWCWKETKNRWGRMSKPTKKKQIIDEKWGLLFQKK